MPEGKASGPLSPQHHLGDGHAGDEVRGVDRRQRFRALHRDGLFVMPNPWDIGSARLLASLGFQALATTSSGHAAALGRADQTVSRDELLAHVEALTAAVDVPFNVDAERCFADPARVAETVGRASLPAPTPDDRRWDRLHDRGKRDRPA